MLRRALVAVVLSVFAASAAQAEAPVASYIFPAGGQRGSTVKVRVGGLFLNKSCLFDMEGHGIQAIKTLKRIPTIWFEGPVLHQPDSQRQEDYPKDMAGEIKLAGDATLGLHSWRLATSQGATPSKLFQVGELPEVVEEEIAGEPIPVPVKPPVTINGRIFPRLDIDSWSFEAKKGQTTVCEVFALRLGSPLEARLEILDNSGKRLAESDLGGDPRLAFTAPADGVYQVRIVDINFAGSQAHVYRLTLRNGPFIDNVFPLGGQRGKSTNVELSGHQLPAKTTSVSLPAKGDTFALQLPGSNAVTLEVDYLPELLEGKTPSPIEVPAICNGRIVQPGEIDVWPLAGKKGTPISLDLRAARLGSSLDGILTIADPAGKEVAKAEAGANLDPSLTFNPPADGTYQVRVQDRFSSRGGASYGYRLRITAPVARPDFRLTFKTDALSLVRGTTQKMPVQLERRGNFQDAVTLSVDGVPMGVTLTNTTIAPKQNATELTFKIDADAPVRTSRLTVRGIGKIEGQEVVHAAISEPRPSGNGVTASETILAAVAIPTPFKVKGVFDMRWAPRGSLHSRRYQIEWGGFSGPLEIALTDKQARHLQGATGAPLVVPAGTPEFEYTIELPPWMETGRTSRVCVMATGVHKDKDGSLHEITFSSVHQNEQMVAVIEPGKLEIELDKSSLRTQPSRTVSLPFKVTRTPGLKGPVRVELVLAPHVKDVRAEPVQLSDAQSDGTLQLHFGSQPGPFNVPLLFRATLTSDRRPYVAETALDVIK